LHQEEKPPYRLAIVPDRRLKELQRLMPLTEEERARVRSILSRELSGKDALYYNNKLDSLYDFQKLGLRALRRPELEKIDRLESAKKQRQQVILEKYRSNSNTIRDRRIEPFHIDPELDTLQAYDVDKQKTSHFRLSRIERVLPTEEGWTCADKHHFKYTDVFRIADDDQEFVQLRLDVWGYNALLEHFPKARAEVNPGAESKTFIFEAKVNAQFLGLINFIMGNADHVEVLYPERLKAKIREEAEKILEKNSS
jgi:predicted DNA-binding transcriptional regulator YafY